MLRKFLVLLMVWAVLVSPASCFDSFWHSEATRLAAAELGFSDDARKIMQLGNFSPDFFGPVADLASTSLPAPGLEALNQYLANNGQDRDSAIFLHFDNLFDELDSNAKFDYLFYRLLSNTQAALASYRKQPGIDDRTRRDFDGAISHEDRSLSNWFRHRMPIGSSELIAPRARKRFHLL